MQGVGRFLGFLAGTWSSWRPTLWEKEGLKIAAVVVLYSNTSAKLVRTVILSLALR